MDVLRAISAELLNWRLPVGSENALQAALHRVLKDTFPCALPGWEREHHFNTRDRIDLWSREFGIGIECKVDGSLPNVIRQLQRYAAEPCLRGLILVTTRRKLLFDGIHIGGVPFAAVWVGRGL